jgi:hypothetical protein
VTRGSGLLVRRSVRRKRLGSDFALGEGWIVGRHVGVIAAGFMAVIDDRIQ